MRVIFLEAVAFLLWAFICFLQFGISGFNILLSGLGVVFGLGFGVAIALRQLSNLEKIGELRTTRKMWAFTLLTTIIVVSVVLYLVFILRVSLLPYVQVMGVSLPLYAQMQSFLYPILLAFYGAIIIFYLNWERKHKKFILFDGFVFTKVYSVPRTERRHLTQPSEKSYCIYCGTENPTDAAFCQECGKKIKPPVT
jgi:hypothetical protein